MARIVLGGLTTLNLATHLDPMTLEIYNVINYFKTPSFTGTDFKLEIDASGNVAPAADNTQAFGSSLKRWLVVWASKIAASASLVVEIAAAEVARFNSAGLQVGTATSNGRVTSDSTGGGTNQAFWGKSSGGAASSTYIAWNATTTGDARFLEFYTEAAATIRGLIDFNRTGVLTRYNTTSDRRLKENIVDAPDAGALIDALKVRSFDWRGANAHTAFGFVAQELFEVAPDSVSQGDEAEVLAEDGRVWAVDASTLVPVLVKELQAVRQRLARLEGVA